jgi:putative intracellular protease/amidase
LREGNSPDSPTRKRRRLECRSRWVDVPVPNENLYSREESSQDIGFFLEDEIKQLGGRFESAGIMEPRVVVDGKLYTGQNPVSAKPLAEKIVDDLRPKSL